MNTCEFSGTRRRGVALIVVIGMLSLLMIMAIAFAVTMRVERSGAGNYAAGVFSRHLAWAALGTAISAVDANMATGGLSVYPNWRVLASSGGGDSVKLVWGEVLKHIPAGDLREEALDANCGWVDAADSGGVIGRFAYMVLNASGYLDCNLVGGSNRWVGLDPHELNLGSLPDLKDANQFFTVRKQDTRYETLEELANLQQGWGFASNQPPTNFMAYSRFPAGWLKNVSGAYSVMSNQVFIGGTVAELQNNSAAIIKALVDSGIVASQAPFVFTNLLDYVDTDSEPRELASACTEAVPMINEVSCTGRVEMIDATNYLVRPRVYVEWVYPFVRPSDETFRLSYSVTTVVSNLATMAVFSETLTDEVDAKYNAGVDVMWYYVLGPFEKAVKVVAAAGEKLSIRVNVKARIKTTAGDKIVDEVPSPWGGVALSLNPTFAGPIPAPVPGPAGFFDDYETWDPRFNWNTADADEGTHFWRRCQAAAKHTLNKENDSAQQWIKQGLDSPDGALAARERDVSMHVSNRGRLLSVGELGHLLRGNRPNPDKFCTIRLFDHNAATVLKDEVLSYFTTLPTNQLRRGVINLNTPYTNVLRTAYIGMRLGYPEATNNTIQSYEVSAVVSLLTNLTQQSGSCANVAQIGGTNAWWTALPNRNEVERDSAIAYSYNLLGVRQNLFIILVASGPFSRGMGTVSSFHKLGDWLGMQRAVAVVWRDPYPDAQGNHAAFVQSFKWLDD